MKNKSICTVFNETSCARNNIIISCFGEFIFCTNCVVLSILFWRWEKWANFTCLHHVNFRSCDLKSSELIFIFFFFFHFLSSFLQSSIKFAFVCHFQIIRWSIKTFIFVHFELIMWMKNYDSSTILTYRFECNSIFSNEKTKFIKCTNVIGSFLATQQNRNNLVEIKLYYLWWNWYLKKGSKMNSIDICNAMMTQHVNKDLNSNYYTPKKGKEKQYPEDKKIKFWKN